MRLALSLAALLATTSLSPAGAETAAEMSEAERAAFDAAVRDYLLREPEVLMEALTILQNRQDEEEAGRVASTFESEREAIYNSADDWSGGNPEGDIVLVEFMDYRCGYCHKAYPEIEELVKSDGNIRFILKELPVLGPESEMLAKFTISIRQLYGDEAYKAAHDALFSQRGNPTPEALASLATKLGHDATAVAAQMEKPEVMAVIEGNRALARGLGINGTPSFVMNDLIAPGYLAPDVMQDALKSLREG